MLKFSNRVGITKARSVVQMDDIDSGLKNKLWNVLYSEFVLIHDNEFQDETKYSKSYRFFINLWHNFFEKTVDKIPKYKSLMFLEIRKYFFDCEWFDVYNLIDFIFLNSNEIDKKSFKNNLNSILENELSGYRLIDSGLIPISDVKELEEIEEVLYKSNQYGFDGVKAHMETALKIFSNKKAPNFRNVIKESISAVESISKTLAADEKAELGKALTILKSKVGIHGALEKGFKSIYGYTSDSDGIRHALLEKDNLDLEDARYMLISCSAFINYLIVKADKAGLLEE